MYGMYGMFTFNGRKVIVPSMSEAIFHTAFGQIPISLIELGVISPELVSMKLIFIYLERCFIFMWC